MNFVTVDAELLAKLNGLDKSFDFCDEQGRVLGRFIPCTSSNGPDDLEPGISYEELRRRAEQFQGRPLKELLAKWERSQ